NRSVYLPVIRDRLPDILELFDFAEPSLVTGERETTNVPTQALYLMNSPFIAERAAALAKRITQEASIPEDQARRAFQLTYSRDPQPDEQARAVQFLNESLPSTKEKPFGALEAFCQALLATAEFRNLD
ncbi:MAG TPA: DUF1553 domain-containing protein, partial [Caulifigura sp.]|nr:DUF1553 domain-containing protein [Caulifigura sp.]